MKLLLLHCNYVEYEAREKALKNAEKILEKKDRLEEALVAFTTVEKDDGIDCKGIIQAGVQEIASVAQKIKAENIMIYPYAHLSTNLASPPVAKDILQGLEHGLSTDFQVKRAPFGWYKAFTISCKGHPLAELSRDVTVKSEPEEKQVESTWYVLTPDGVFHDANTFDFSSHQDLYKFYQYEIKKSRGSEKEPAHIALMKDLELVDYEPGSDPGNMRWYPKGYLIKKLLERKVEEICLAAGAMQVDTPILYDKNHPSLKKYVEKFPARQYSIKSRERDLFLRFAACFGQYLMAHDMTISYKHLPLRFFEIARSFRREKHGELSGIKRLRSFTMPDMHSLCDGNTQALEEFLNQFSLSLDWMTALGLDYEVGIRFTQDFLDKNRDFAHMLAQRVDKPVLLEVWNERYFYFVIKFECNLIDSLKKAFALSTVQLDVDNPHSFGITYIDETGKEQYPLLLHASISGGIDRCLCALLENEAVKINQGEKGSFPFWLSPTQVRVIPVKDEFLSECQKMASILQGRVDIDDRDLSISKRIRDAEKEWVPLIIVVGERECKEKIYTPRYRMPLQGKKECTLPELQKYIQSQIDEYPMAPLPLPVHLSKRPRFRG